MMHPCGLAIVASRDRYRQHGDSDVTIHTYVDAGDAYVRTCLKIKLY